MSRSSRPHVKDGGLPSDLESIRSRVSITNQAPHHTSAILDPDAFASLQLDNSWNQEVFEKHFRIAVQSIERRGDMVRDPVSGVETESDSDRIVFDMVGIEAPLANALRRILLSEVPTMAIERVILFQNTSIIQDEVLAHRLGLVPIYADPRQFQYVRESATQASARRKPRNPKERDDKSVTSTQHPDGEENELNTLVFVLDVKCTRKIDPKTGRPAGEDKADADKYDNHLITSSHLKWIPQGRQAQRFADPARRPRPYYDDIILAKLRPGQSIEAELHVEKGIGQSHAKWSPVATASYRLMPEILFTTPIEGEMAQELKQKCPMNVFDIEDIGGKPTATVARPRNCTMCRECTRGEVADGIGMGGAWSDRVKLRRVRDHFIFSVETTGAYTPTEVVREAIKVLKEKALTIKRLCQGEENKDEEDDEEEEEEEIDMTQTRRAPTRAEVEAKSKEMDEDDDESDEQADESSDDENGSD